MALSVYTPTGIVHETSVDFTKRVLTEPVHLVQYDESLPVVAVTCLDAGQYLTLTALDTVSIRMDKGDGTFIYNPALGMSADGHIVYIQITLQMTANYGRFEPVIELLRDGGYGASSPIPLFIDANPVPNSEIQSTSQWESLNDIVARANAIVAGDAVEFTEAETRENINSGENLITMFGKIKKWFTDFGAAAWKAVANNLTTAAADQAVLDAYQGKLIGDRLSAIEGRQVLYAFGNSQDNPTYHTWVDTVSLVCPANTGRWVILGTLNVNGYAGEMEQLINFRVEPNPETALRNTARVTTRDGGGLCSWGYLTPHNVDRTVTINTYVYDQISSSTAWRFYAVLMLVNLG